jgi:uncharacterized membrane protein HdeD (DUF308 family)
MSVIPSETRTRRHIEFEPSLSKGWRWLLILGIVQLAAGVIAIGLPAAATLAATLVIGWLLLISAIFQLIHAFTVHRWRGFALHLVSALLYGAAGVLLFVKPVQAAAGLTLVLAALLLADGAVRAALAWRVRPRDGWGWVLAGAFASLILGALILIDWPATAIWALGVLLGVQLIVSGATNAGLAIVCRNRTRAPVVVR